MKLVVLAAALTAASALAEQPPVQPVAGVIGLDLDVASNCLSLRSMREQEIGVPVFAVEDGIVMESRNGVVRIAHAAGTGTRYSNVAAIAAPLGQHVAAGTQLGVVGAGVDARAPQVCVEGAALIPPPAGPFVHGIAFSDRPFADSRPYPYDDTARGATFPRGFRRVHFNMQLANVPRLSWFNIDFRKPDGSLVHYTNSVVDRFPAKSFGWPVDLNLDQPGQWHLVFDINGRRVGEYPFTVLDFNESGGNRAPLPLRVALDGGDVPRCVVENGPLADPDYDVVSYDYEWRVNGAVVRAVRSAARSDVLSRSLASGARALSCTVTASDGIARGSAFTVTAGFAQPARRRTAPR